jgi:hypothetical protein
MRFPMGTASFEVFSRQMRFIPRPRGIHRILHEKPQGGTAPLPETVILFRKNF